MAPSTAHTHPSSTTTSTRCRASLCLLYGHNAPPGGDCDTVLLLMPGGDLPPPPPELYALHNSHMFSCTSGVNCY